MPREGCRRGLLLIVMPENVANEKKKSSSSRIIAMLIKQLPPTPGAREYEEL